MSTPRKPVKVLTDLLTKKQIIKQDEFGNIVFNVSGALGNGHISSSLPITGSSAFFVSASVNSRDEFLNIPIVTSSLGEYYVYDIDQAFHAIDTVFETANKEDTEAAYNRLRFTEVGFFENDGTKVVVLPATASSGDARFPTSSLDYIDVSVATQESGSSGWTYDLIAVEIVVSGALNDEVQVLLDAAALSSVDRYRIIAVNENPADYVIT